MKELLDVEEAVEIKPFEKKLLRTGELIVLTFFWTTGGPFGIESAVYSGGALFTILGLALVIVLWCLPQALMAAELSLLTGANGGSIIWVQRAFGDFGGYLNAQCSLCLSIVNLSVLVVLCINYIDSAIVLELWHRYVASAIFIFLIILINLNGVEWVSNLSIPILVAVFIPFVTELLMIPISHRKVHWEALIAMPDHINFGPFISNLVWAFGGFDVMGVLAGDIEGGVSTYIRGIAATMPLILFTYVFPITLNILVFPDHTLWSTRTFTDVAYSYASTLGVSMIVASVLSHFGQFNAGMAAAATLIWAMATGSGGNQYLPEVLGKTTEKEVPYVAIIALGSISFILTSFTYNFLLQLYLLLRLVIVFLEYGSLIYLKWKEPDTPRPYSVPGGIPGAVSLFVPTLALSGLALAYTEIGAIIWGGGTIGVILLSYLLLIAWNYAYNYWRKSKERQASLLLQEAK